MPRCCSICSVRWWQPGHRSRTPCRSSPVQATPISGRPSPGSVRPGSSEPHGSRRGSPPGNRSGIQQRIPRPPAVRAPLRLSRRHSGAAPNATGYGPLRIFVGVCVSPRPQGHRRPRSCMPTPSSYDDDTTARSPGSQPRWGCSSCCRSVCAPCRPSSASAWCPSSWVSCRLSSAQPTGPGKRSARASSPAGHPTVGCRAGHPSLNRRSTVGHPPALARSPAPLSAVDHGVIHLPASDVTEAEGRRQS